MIQVALSKQQAEKLATIRRITPKIPYISGLTCVWLVTYSCIKLYIAEALKRKVSLHSAPPDILIFIALTEKDAMCAFAVATLLLLTAYSVYTNNMLLLSVLQERKDTRDDDGL